MKHPTVYIVTVCVKYRIITSATCPEDAYDEADYTIDKGDPTQYEVDRTYPEIEEIETEHEYEKEIDDDAA